MKLVTRIIDALPEFARSRIRNRYWKIKSRLLYQSLYRVLDLEHILRSGLTVKVASKGEWWTYNDIFVDGEYDVPIHAAFKSRSLEQPFIVLDIGANVGYFSFRVLDLISQHDGERFDPNITMVEGSPKTFLELQERIQSQSQFTSRVRVVHGLVGQSLGEGIIRESGIHVKSTTIDVAEADGVKVDFVDLDALMRDKPEIDLLKCDIEGAELLFTQNYSDLLRKVKHAVFELHHDQCDTTQCVRDLERLGFRQTILRNSPSFSVCLFSRR